MSSAKTLFVLITALTILLCAGCRKKTTEQPKPASETTQPAQPNADHPGAAAKNEQTIVPPKTTSPASAGEMNQPAQVEQPQEKRPSLYSPPIKRPENIKSAATNITSETELNLNQFASLKSSEEKTDWISNFAEAHPDQIAAMAETAMSDADTEVRSAALDAVIENETPAPAAVEKAMQDTDEEVREKAVEACKFVEDKQADDLLKKAISDQSESVREMALQTADEKNDDTKLNFYKASLASKFENVKDAAIAALVDMSSPQAVDVLLEGLKDSDANFRDDVIQALDFLIDHECTSYGECKSWWNANRHRFDNELNEKD
jgi:HEAT repeat protein